MTVVGDDRTERKPMTARLSPEAREGFDLFAYAVRSSRPDYTALMEALGLYLFEHDGRLWTLTENAQREVVRRAFDIASERGSRRSR